MKLVFPQSYALSNYARFTFSTRLLVFTVIAVIVFGLLIQFLPTALEIFCVKLTLNESIY